jgi:hypothetical protein
LKKRTEGFIKAMTEGGVGSDMEIDTVNINIQLGISSLTTKIDTAILDFNTKRDAALVEFETKFAAMLPLIHTALIDSLTDISTKVDTQLTSIITDMGTEMVKILDGVEQEVLGKIEEAMEPHDEVLAELNGDMDEAAEDAAWAYDHPVLSAIGDVLSFIGMLVLGILAALALIFIFFYAIAAAIALLVYLGCTLLVAQIIVYGGLLTLLIINSVSAYNQRVAAGQEGGFWTGVKSVFDVVGVTDIYRAFTDENMSAAERGWAIGFNGTNLIAIFRGGRINKTITKTMPTRLTNPTRGGFWTLLKNKFGVKAPVSKTLPGRQPVKIASGVKDEPGDFHFNMKNKLLSEKQQDLLARLASEDDLGVGVARIGKREVTPSDLANLTNVEKVEFAIVMDRNGQRYLVKMGSYKGGDLPPYADKLLMHSHPYDNNAGTALWISEADIQAIAIFKQKYSYMVTVDGRVWKFTQNTAPNGTGQLVRDMNYQGWYSPKK